MSSTKRIQNKSSRTAAYTCTCRAASYMESNPLLKSDDHIAVKILPRLVKYLLKIRFLNLQGKIAPAGIYPYVIARTKYIDTIFKKAINDGAEQIVIFGAGFDSRAIRLTEKGSVINIYEIDTPLTLDAKRKQFIKRDITIPKNNIYIPIDFDREDIKEKLEKSSVSVSKKTLFILEGLIMYLSIEAVDYTFKLINEYSVPGSLVVFDYIFASVLRQEEKYYGEREIFDRVKKDEESWTYGIEEGEIEDFLSAYSLDLLEHLDSVTLEKKYFTDNTGRIISKVNGTHCIVLARKS